MVEYIAQSLPFVTYRTGEVAEQVQKDMPMFIMQNFDVTEWVLQINKVLQADQKKLEDQLEAIFRKNYSAEAYYEKCISIYKKGLSV